MDSENELWLSIARTNGDYEVSSLGRMRSVDRTIVDSLGRKRYLKGTVVEPYTNAGGYLSIRLGRGRPTMVHTEVALAFLGSRPFGHYVCHNDGNKLNNKVSNLRFDTPKHNQADSLVHGTRKLGSSRTNAKLKEQQVSEIRSLIRTGSSPANIGKRYGVSAATVYKILKGESWTHVP